MSKKIVPDTARPAIKRAADRAYDEIRWAVGDSWEAAAILHRLAVESWCEGYALGREHGQQGAAHE